jgi:hypothetical protein
MSAKVVRRIYESALSSKLKPTAAVMASFGNEHGEKIFPGIDLIAWLLDVDRRTVERNLAALRSLGILVPLSTARGGRLPGGRGNTVHYRFRADALPQRPPYKPRHTRQGSATENPDTHDGLIGAGTPTAETETPTFKTGTPTPMSLNPDASVGRSSQECSRGPIREARAARADSPPTEEEYAERIRLLNPELRDRLLQRAARRTADATR